jgi:ribose/xylose/arabinose/galactoside ABC-type transport system permease subunit
MIKFKLWRKLRGALNQQLLVTLFMAVLFGCFAITKPAFASWTSINNILRTICLYGFASLGMTPVILLGGADLSAGSVMALAGSVGAGLLGSAIGAANPVHLPFMATVIITLVITTLVGMFNGMLVGKFNIAPFVATLAVMSITRGLVYIFTDFIVQGIPGSPITFMNDGYTFLDSGEIGPIPFQLVLFVMVVFAMFILMNHSRMGRDIYAVGGNQETARLSGIRTQKTIVTGYGLCGLLVGISGLLLVGKLSSASTVAAEGYELDFITAVALGGCSMAGGRGSILGTVAGVSFLAVLNNGLNMINVQSFYQYLIKGIILVLAVYSDKLLQK